MQINWFTHSFDPHDGYGNMCSTLVRKLMQRGICITPIAKDSLKWAGWLQRAAGIDFSRLTIAMTPGGNVHPVPGLQWALTMYEADRIPAEWVTNLNTHTRRLIVPSDWCKTAFEASGVKVPISVVLGGTDPLAYPMIEHQHKGRPYTFMALGDRGSRKGHDFVWQAFYREFKPDEDVRLIIKSRAGNMANVGDTSLLDPRVSIWRDDTPSLADAFIHADCFVFPSRGEGWGMPPREAAMMGLPVIATRYSGLTHGIDEWAACIVESYTLRQATIDGGGQWAISDVDEVAAHMRWCYENREEAGNRGRRAAAWLRENQTYEHTVAGLIELLETVL